MLCTEFCSSTLLSREECSEGIWEGVSALNYWNINRVTEQYLVKAYPTMQRWYAYIFQVDKRFLTPVSDKVAKFYLLPSLGSRKLPGEAEYVLLLNSYSTGKRFKLDISLICSHSASLPCVMLTSWQFCLSVVSSVPKPADGADIERNKTPSPELGYQRNDSDSQWECDFLRDVQERVTCVCIHTGIGGYTLRHTL